ncbi:MAG: glycosyltransferase family 2 protein [Chloroflexota bacterium]|nr:MAG: glycosyltransferase family 2 protein [Chloroflexota bacterium]
MKLIVQIPCFNEAATLPAVVRAIPRQIAGFERVEIVVIDDGSTDGTAELAHSVGVDHVVRHIGNKGLAQAFRTGIDVCLRLGADVIVNTDGDNQYPQADIPRLVEPISSGRAEMVVADRQIGRIEHFSPAKKVLQALGSWTVRQVSRTDVPDAPSGFRAYSREAAMRLNIVSEYSYTLETLIQAGARRTSIAYVPVTVNAKTRPSRLMGSTLNYIKHQGATIVRTYAMHEPLKVFTVIGAALFAIGLALVIRFGYFFLFGYPGHIQSLVLGAALLGLGLQVGLNGILADLIAANRRLVEEALYKLRRLEDTNAGSTRDSTGATAPLPPESGRSDH